MQIDLTLIALGVAAIAAPASASSSASAQVSATVQNGNGSTVAQEKKYCIQYEQMVGSRLNRQECKTKREWAKEGVDVDKLLNE